MAFDESPATLRAYLHTLVRRLAEGPEPVAYVLRAAPNEATLDVVGRSQPLLLVTWESNAPDVVEAMAVAIRRIANEAYQDGCHIAIVGGGAPAQEFLTSFRLGPRFSLHHVGTDGEVWTRGPRFGPLVKAAREIVASGQLLPPLTPAEVAASRVIAERELETEKAFRKALSARKPIATFAIIATCAALFLLKLEWGGGDVVDVRMGAVNGGLLRQGEWWRLLAGAFLHADPVHLGSNMFSLWALGMFLERLVGTARFTVLYVVSAIAGAAFTSFVHEGSSVGASGAIFGLLGALAAVALRQRRIVPFAVVTSLKYTLVPTIVLNAFISFLPRVDATAHLGGGLAGFLIVGSGLLVRGLPNAGANTPLREGGWRGLAVLSALACAASIGAALVHGRPWEIQAGPSWERRSLPGVPFTIEVPAGLALGAHGVEGGVNKAVFGDFLRDPMQLEVRVEKAHGGLSPSDAAELEDAEPGAKLVRPPRQVDLDTGPLLFAEVDWKDGMKEHLVVTYRDGFRFRFTFRVRPGASPEWENAFSTVVASVAHRE